MAKKELTKSKTRKAALAVLCAAAVTCTAFAAACQPSGGGSNKDDEDKKAEDTQLLSNGNFEFYTVPKDAVYLIKPVQDWSRSGDSSGAMSGIVGTSEKAWEDITSSELADKLDKNNDLSSSDDDYVDYNGMKSADIPYRDPYAAKLDAGDVKDDTIINKNDLTYAEFLGIVTEGEGDGTKYKYGETQVYLNSDDGDYYFDAEFTKPVRRDTVKNPETHYGSYKEEGGKHYLGSKEIYVDDNGNYYKDENKEYSEGNVLMIHNYPTDSKYNGIQQYYSSETVRLEARTAAKISLWVKTSDLKFDKGYSLLDEQDRGAYIEVVQTVGGTTIDEFTIKAINTEKIIKDNPALNANNGWLQYNIYVNACDFAECTVQLRLGLGKSSGETCTGYAFFDDVEVEKKLSISETGYETVKDEIKTNKTSCTLANTEDEKVFYADKEVRGASGESAARHSTHFNYYVDLASESGATTVADGYQTVALSESNVTAALTTEKEDNKTYASATTYAGNVKGLTKDSGTYELYKKTEARITDKDLLGLFSSSDSFTGTGIQENHATALASSLLEGDKAFSKLPNYTSDSKALVMLSTWGAAYTSTIKSDNFTLNAGECMIVSFWSKTSDLNGKTAATFKIYDVADADKENAQSFSLDSTGVTTDIDDNKDIYNGWVQCFFFVQNNTKEDNKTFVIDFNFGNTSIISATSYDSGWVALANMQTLKISEEVCNLTPSTTYIKKFQFDADSTDKTPDKFAEATGTSDISTEIALPDGYNGVNGGSSSVSDADHSHNFDVNNTHHEAGLINRDNFFNESDQPADWHNVLKSFSASATNWDEVFSKDCYQPLIIVNNLRRYADDAHATEETFKTGGYYIRIEDGDTTSYAGAIEDNAGRKYRPVTDSDTWNEEETYYSFKQVCNYGFVGATQTISANDYKTISVKVMVSGNAKAYIYLVDPTTREVMGYTAPGYTFWYDDEGNVLDAEFDKEWTESEREEHTVYELQDNGLYKDKEGNYVANLYNLKKVYLKDKLTIYYDKDGNEVRSSRFEDGVDYFLDSAATTPAPYRLCNSEGKPVYEYKDGGIYYIVKGKRTDTKVVNFNKDYARYDYTELNEEYVAEVGNTNGKWVTVNFIVHTGNEEKTYRLELWSGKRGETGASNDLTDPTFASGAIAFDHSSYSITSSNYESVLRTDAESYEKQIIAQYQELLKAHADEFEKDGTIKDYEDLAEKYKTEIGEANLTALKATYTAKYYTYSLYDTEAFVPYNKEVAADGETGYEYTAPESESLAFFKNATKSGDEITSYNTFIDYSAVEQEIKYTTPATDNNTDDTTTTTNAGEFWLQLASILLVVVLLFVLLALVARIIIKKIRRKKNVKAQSKNVYRKRERYMRKLHIEEEETEEIDNPALANAEKEEAKETPAEAESSEETAETPAEEESTEKESSEEAPVETTEAPVEEAPAAEEKPAETTETPSESNEEKPE